MPLLHGATRAPQCVQCTRALRLLSARAAPASTTTSFSFAARMPATSVVTATSAATSSRDGRFGAHVRFFTQSAHLAAKRRPRDKEKVNPAELPDDDFDPTMEELLRGPDEELDEGEFDNVPGEDIMSDAQPESTSKSKSPSPTSYYRLFPKTLPKGPPPAGPFAIDTRALHREFLQLQAAAHPDFHHAAAGRSSSSSTDKARAEALSSLINEAYRTLASPLLRAQYLLRTQHGIDLAGDEGMLMGGPSEANLLMEVMDVREQIEWAAREEELAPIRAANDARMRESEAVLAGAFAANDIATARHEAMRLRYWVNVDEALKNWGEAAGAYFDHH